MPTPFEISFKRTSSAGSTPNAAGERERESKLTGHTGPVKTSGSRKPLGHPAASGEPPTLSRGLRAAARPCASSALRRVVATAEDGLSATAGHPRLRGRRRRCQREPVYLRGDAASYIRRPRRARPGATKDPLGKRGVQGDLTTNMTYTTPLARTGSSRILLAPPWAEGLATAWYSESSDLNQCVVSYNPCPGWEAHGRSHH